MDQSEAIAEAKLFAHTAYTATSNEILRNGKDDLSKMHHRMAARGIGGVSGAIIHETAQILGEQIRALTQAHLDAILEGYELFEVTIDDQMAADICQEVMAGLNQRLAGARNYRFVGAPSSAVAVYPALLGQSVGLSAASIKTQIDRKRLMRKKTEPGLTSINVYHVTGSNNRWLTNSQDHSLNVVTQSSEQIFATLREKIEVTLPDGDEKKDILEKIMAMEASENSAPFKRHYSDFIAAAANHMTLIAPFIPALTEMLHRVL